MPSAAYTSRLLDGFFSGADGAVDSGSGAHAGGALSSDGAAAAAFDAGAVQLAPPPLTICVTVFVVGVAVGAAVDVALCVGFVSPSFGGVMTEPGSFTVGLTGPMTSNRCPSSDRRCPTMKTVGFRLEAG